MRVIQIEGVIGWDVTGRDIRRQLAAANGEDIKAEISSIGGNVLEGLEIFNRLRNYSGRVHTHILATAASMASYIHLAGDVRTAEDNAVFMIHNVRGFGGGDHIELRKRADVFEGLSVLLANEYARAMKIPVAQVRALMDAETFYFGAEILDAGFVSSIEQGDGTVNRDDAIATARLALEDCVAKMRSDEQPSEELQQVAALLGDFKAQNGGAPTDDVDDNDLTPANKGRDLTQEVVMDLQKLKAEHPALYAQVVQEGIEKGAASTLDDVKAHLTMGKSYGAMDYAIACIEEGKSLSDQSVIAGYIAAGRTAQDIAGKAEDTPAGDLSNVDDQDGDAAERALLDAVMGQSKKSGAPVAPGKEV